MLNKGAGGGGGDRLLWVDVVPDSVHWRAVSSTVVYLRAV